MTEYPGQYTEQNDDASERYKLRLFVNGTSPISLRAISNITVVLEEHLQGKYDLEVIDAHQYPALVQSENVTAVPMLIKNNPSPRRRLIGDMSDTMKVLRGLGLAQ